MVSFLFAWLRNKPQIIQIKSSEFNEMKWNWRTAGFWLDVWWVMAGAQPSSAAKLHFTNSVASISLSLPYLFIAPAKKASEII